MNKAKAFDIPKQDVMKAFKLVKANAGAAGVDRQSIQDFESNLKDNLYKIWNRMSSGTYFPPPVKAVTIPKKSGGERVLGVPTVADRVAQAVVRQNFEPLIEPHFLPDSYGYRPGKSALDAVGVTRERCWRYAWVLEFDIKGLFDKAVRRHTDCRWVLLYIERWLAAPLQLQDGTKVTRDKGTPQGGVISPVLANLFLHYAFDVWISRKFPKLKWCRYADDGLVHCRSESEALQLRRQLAARFKECGLEMHPEKTRIVYCKNWCRKKPYPCTSFDFLGYTFRPRSVMSRKRRRLFLNFTPAISKNAKSAIRRETRTFRNWSNLSLEDIARLYNPKLRGWINYYGRYNRSALTPVLRHFNQTLVAWAMKKHKPLHGRKTRASRFLLGIQRRNPRLFHHWAIGMPATFA